MYSPINGFTKSKILGIIEARPTTGAAVRNDGQTCAYKGADGARCAVGLFIPDGHPSEDHWGNVATLLKQYPDLWSHMPLPVEGLLALQSVHDNESRGSGVQQFSGHAKGAMIAWVNANVEG